jgi:hypothetical protein
MMVPFLVAVGEQGVPGEASGVRSSDVNGGSRR